MLNCIWLDWPRILVKNELVLSLCASFRGSDPLAVSSLTFWFNEEAYHANIATTLYRAEHRLSC